MQSNVGNNMEHLRYVALRWKQYITIYVIRLSIAMPAVRART